MRRCIYSNYQRQTEKMNGRQISTKVNTDTSFIPTNALGGRGKSENDK